jgi:hypothetical protein
VLVLAREIKHLRGLDEAITVIVHLVVDLIDLIQALRMHDHGEVTASLGMCNCEVSFTECDLSGRGSFTHTVLEEEDKRRNTKKKTKEGKSRRRRRMRNKRIHI